jgi:hypothetical protein
VRESPFKIKEEIFRIANRAARTSPKRVEHGELIIELQEITDSEKLLITAAWAEKGQIAV